MLAILQFYVSGFWTWLGIMAGLAVVSGAVGNVLAMVISLILFPTCS